MRWTVSDLQLLLGPLPDWAAIRSYCNAVRSSSLGERRFTAAAPLHADAHMMLTLGWPIHIGQAGMRGSLVAQALPETSSIQISTW